MVKMKKIEYKSNYLYFYVGCQKTICSKIRNIKRIDIYCYIVYIIYIQYNRWCS
ncbi:hypothetical protein Cst_c08020 [Thermoclostridium stercorarium subsp. stercorarium DSM 8532]|uniref:Uncharacterized protein n=1 Tax=Thermoclostridium stercorarium (strain ATCC 35414 / DSM 8532 / NCIMB 11754) TaxID=1121335 RepID=L7VMD5_THES1|nr:hypothetical protein Cst_c08020 [Thermoclostridium stercorarium subsp. stercorarium DSM 8532]